MAEQKENIMRKIKIEKIVLNVGGTGEYLEKGVKLLKIITGRKAAKMKSTKRIPAFSVRPGLEVGCVVTIRKDIKNLLDRLLKAVDNKIRKKQVCKNGFSFGIKEYIEISGLEYQRDIGVMGFDVTIVFVRAGRRVKIKKIKQGHFPEKQSVSKEEIIKFMEEHFKTKFV